MNYETFSKQIGKAKILRFDLETGETTEEESRRFFKLLSDNVLTDNQMDMLNYILEGGVFRTAFTRYTINK